MKRIFIDFDGTISPTHGTDDPPQKDTIESINRLYDAKCEIVIYSCRANLEICDPKSINEMENYLKRYGIKYTEIAHGKPYYDYIIDDKAFNPNWRCWSMIADNILGLSP